MTIKKAKNNEEEIQYMTLYKTHVHIIHTTLRYDKHTLATARTTSNGFLKHEKR